MKFKLIALTMLMTMMLTACGSAEDTEKNKIYQEEIATTGPLTEIEDFSQMISFLEADPKWDPDKIEIEYFVQKVEVADEAADVDTQIIVAAYAKNLESGNTKYTTNAAVWPYIDPQSEDGSVLEAKTEWWNEGIPYSAESIIEDAMREYGGSEEDMVLNQKYILYTTFEEE